MDREDKLDHGKDEAKEDKSKPIKHIHIEKLDDGTYKMSAESENFGPNSSFKSSHPDHKHLMLALNDHLTSPHLPALGNGQRFKQLTDKLAQQPGVKNPAGLAASIGRKKFGANKFDALSY